jgi:hypothetical protein
MQIMLCLMAAGGRGGIRTHVPLRTTAFREQLVTTTSILFRGDSKDDLEQVKGIEPSWSAWEAEVLPLNYTCMNCLLE